MAVYTKLAAAEIKNLINQYDIGEMQDFCGIEEGTQNTNYLIHTDQKYILTIYEKRVRAADLPFFLGLTEHLADSGIPCPRPVHDKNGNVLQEIHGKKAAVVGFLNGKSVTEITAEHCRELGAILAKMHLAAADFPLKRHNNMGKDSWRELFGKIKGRIAEIPGIDGDTIKRALEKLDNEWPANLPAGIIHADLFPDNVFFSPTPHLTSPRKRGEGKILNPPPQEGEGRVGVARENLTGVIDFYFACNDFFSLDLAICVNAWCFDSVTPSHDGVREKEPDTGIRRYDFNKEKAAAMFAGYDSVRKITKEESENFRILCLGAALCFLLIRAHDWLDPKTRHRDPLEYWRKLEFFLKSPTAFLSE